MSGTFTLIADEFKLTTPILHLSPMPLNYSKLNDTEIPTYFQPEVQILSVGNGVIQREPAGHFQIVVTSALGNNLTSYPMPVSGRTRCIEVGESQEDVKQAIAAILFNVSALSQDEPVSINRLFTVSVSKVGDGSQRSNYSTSYHIKFSPMDIFDKSFYDQMKVQIDKTRCEKIRLFSFAAIM
jgi:hypothetical protein